MNRNEIPAYAQELVQLALENGAVDAVPFVLSDIAFDERTLLKCMFGCSDWGKGLTCPSREGFPDLPTRKRMLSNYKWGIIIHAHSKAPSQRASLMLEGRAFRDGYYMAFSMSDCGLCKECAGQSGCKECRHPDKARPAFHSVGIDVFKTVRQLGMEIETLPDREYQPQNWYSCVWVE